MKKIFVLPVAIIIIATFFIFKNNSNSQKNEPIIKNNSNIKLKDIENYHLRNDFEDEIAKELFAEKIVNNYTLKFFKFFEKQFGNMTLDENFAAVRKFLYDKMDPEEAEKLFQLYKKFQKYQSELTKEMKNWGYPTTTEETIEYLRKIQNYRRNYFGNKTADVLFGIDVKSREYPIRRKGIIGNTELYGAEKEEQIKELNENMWGEEADSVEEYSKPIVQYQEKLSMYNRDLEEMDVSEKEIKIKEFREKIFDTDTIVRMEAVDRQIAESITQINEYRNTEQEINDDIDLNADEKTKKIKDLQKQYFGDNIEAFQRQEKMRLANEKYKETLQK